MEFATSNGSATAGSDYTAASGILTFPQGTTSQNIKVPVLRDAVRDLPSDGWGVYAIWSRPYECLYIGKSADGKSVKTRLLAHLLPQERHSNRRLHDALYLNRDHAEFSVCLTDSPEWATKLEDRLIKHYQPECNRLLK